MCLNRLAKKCKGRCNCCSSTRLDALEDAGSRSIAAAVFSYPLLQYANDHTFDVDDLYPTVIVILLSFYVLYRKYNKRVNELNQIKNTERKLERAVKLMGQLVEEEDTEIKTSAELDKKIDSTEQPQLTLPGQVNTTIEKKDELKDVKKPKDNKAELKKQKFAAAKKFVEKNKSGIHIPTGKAKPKTTPKTKNNNKGIYPKNSANTDFKKPAVTIEVAPKKVVDTTPEELKGMTTYTNLENKASENKPAAAQAPDQGNQKKEGFFSHFSFGSLFSSSSKKSDDTSPSNGSQPKVGTHPSNNSVSVTIHSGSPSAASVDLKPTADELKSTPTQGDDLKNISTAKAAANKGKPGLAKQRKTIGAVNNSNFLGTSANKKAAPTPPVASRRVSTLNS